MTYVWSARVPGTAGLPGTHGARVPAGAARTVMGVVLLLVVLGPAAGSLPAAEPPYEGWREVRTEHFRIIFEPAHADAAAEVASVAEDVYEAVTPTLGFRPQTVPVVIRGRTAQANGFYSPFPHHITLYVSSPSGPLLGARHTSWLRLLLTHELTHFVQLSDRTGMFGGLSRVFGHDVSVFSFPFMPGWYVEALTTLNETRLTTGGRGRNPFFEMQVKAPVLEGKLWSLDQASYESAFAPRGRVYIAGYVLADYLTRTYGEDVYARIHREFERAPFLGMGRAIRRETGIGSDELYADMHAELIRRFAADAGLPQGERLTPEEPGNWYLPVLSERGLLGYVSTPDRRAGVYRLELEGGTGISGGASVRRAELVYAVNPTDPFSVDVSRNGRVVVAAVPRPDPGHPAGSVSYSEIRLYDIESGEERRLTDRTRMLHPALSPEGDRVVAVERRGPYSRLVELDREDGDLQVLYEPEQATVLTPRFGPDGDRIVFTEHARGYQDIMLFEDGRVRPLRGRDAAGEYAPRFADRHTVYFSSDRNGRLELFSHHIPTGEERRIVQDRIAAWTGIPVDDGILYGSYASEGYVLRRAGMAAPSGAPSGAAAGPAGGPADGPADGRTAAPPASSTTPPPPINPAPLPERRVYRDVPRPLAWAPYLELYADTGGDVRVPAGVYLYGAGILGRTSWDSVLAVDAYAGHPRADLSARNDPGPLSLDYAFSYAYRPRAADEYRLLLSNSVTARAVPWYRRGAADASGLSVSLGNELISDRTDDAAFTAAETFGRIEPEREVDLFAGARIAHAAFAPAAAYYGGFASEAETEVRYTPAVLDAEEPRVETSSAVGVHLPTGLAQTVAGLRLAGVTSTTGSVEGLLLPRSDAEWESQDGDVKLLGRLEYRVPLGLSDRPLPGLRPYRPALLGLGSLVYAESAVYFDVDDGATAVEDSIFFGLETEGRFTLLHLPLTAGVGIAARVAADFSEPVGEDDWRVYAFVSSDLTARTDALSRGVVSAGDSLR